MEVHGIFVSSAGTLTTFISEPSSKVTYYLSWDTASGSTANSIIVKQLPAFSYNSGNLLKDSWQGPTRSFYIADSTSLLNYSPFTTTVGGIMLYNTIDACTTD
jgi:hypothetical protein